MKITQNTDATDIEQSCLGLDCTRDTFPPDIRDHIHRDRGLHIQIRHNRDKQTFAQANDFARLIAAAPELLEALEQAVEFCETLAADGGRSADLRAAYTAIARAKGTP